MLFMGIDVGSSGCKISVVDEKGSLLYSSERRYSFSYEGETSELNPKEVLENVFCAIRDITAKNSMRELATISVTSFGEMFVLLDRNKNVLCHSISYSDRRGKEEAEAIAGEFGADKIYSITGATVDAMYSLPKLLWIKQHRPEIYGKASKLCLFADFILVKLGAEYHMDFSLAARTLMFDVKNKCWARDVLAYAGIDESMLSEPVPSGTVVGQMDAKIAAELGLPKGVRLLAGGHDQSCAALGAGILREGTALDGMGSNECIVPSFDRLMLNDTMKKSNLVCVPYIIPGMYVTYAFNRTSGTVLDWYRRILGNISYDELFADLKETPSKMLFLPHFAGAATPYMDDEATGAIVGLHLGTSREEITKSIIEGFNYEVMINLQCLRDSGFRVRELFASGGMSRNDKLLQIKADMLGIPIYRLANSQTGTMAMAILGSVAVGAYKDIPSAAAELVRRDKVFYPNEERHEAYAKTFEQYQRMYTAVKSIQGRK